jgi:hypothetical protein
MINEQVNEQFLKQFPKYNILRNPKPFLTILEFIKSSENDKTTITMDKVAKYMNDNDKGVICSRPTTLKYLSSLLAEGILLEKNRRNKYFHDLVIDENYDFLGLLEEIFLYQVERLNELLQPFQILVKDKKIVISHDMDRGHGEISHLSELSLSVSIIDEMKKGIQQTAKTAKTTKIRRKV